MMSEAGGRPLGTSVLQHGEFSSSKAARAVGMFEERSRVIMLLLMMMMMMISHTRMGYTTNTLCI